MTADAYVTGDDDALVTSVRVVHPDGHHARVTVWVRHQNAGTLVVDPADASEIVRRLTAASPIVHVLYQGFAVCGFPGIPLAWPTGHRWVGVLEWREASCPQCRRRTPELTTVVVP